MKHAFAIPLLLGLLGPPSFAERPGAVVELRLEDRYAFEGWGTSLCWWANRVGDWPDEPLADLVEAITDPETGLGLSVFRYNIGGGENPQHDHMRPGGEMPGFRGAAGAPIDADADARQRRVLLRLIAVTEAPIVEAFSNSPPYWMTNSGCASGAADGRSNLPDERVGQFTAYLADVVRLYRDRYGVTFRTLAPFNEPNQTWWVAEKTQEGCHFTEAQMATVVKQLHGELRSRGLSGATTVSVTDAHDIDLALRNARSFDAETLGLIEQVNTHSYRGTERAELSDFCRAAGKRLWQSESGPMDLPSGPAPHLRMVERLALDLNDLRPAAWLTWQVVGIRDKSDWACLNADSRSHAFRPNRLFWLFRQFTRRIRPGDEIVPTTDPTAVVAVSESRGTLTVVVTNANREERDYAVSLASLKTDLSKPTAYRSDGGPRREADEVARLSGGRLTVRAAPLEVVTVTLRSDR